MEEASRKPCSICNIFVRDWFESTLYQNNEFSTQLRRKSIIKYSKEIADILYRLTIQLLFLTPETLVRSEEYDADRTLNVYKSGGELIKNELLPTDIQFMMLCFYRNEMIKLIMEQSFSTDLEFLLALLTDLNCTKESLVISQWISDCLLQLRMIEMMHNDHRRLWI